MSEGRSPLLPKASPRPPRQGRSKAEGLVLFPDLTLREPAGLVEKRDAGWHWRRRWRDRGAGGDGAVRWASEPPSAAGGQKLESFYSARSVVNAETPWRRYTCFIFRIGTVEQSTKRKIAKVCNEIIVQGLAGTFNMPTSYQ